MVCVVALNVAACVCAERVRYIPNPPRTPHIDALANGPNSVVFHRFYAGSGVCSPTRSAALTGRTPDRECIFDAEGCGQVRACVGAIFCA